MKSLMIGGMAVLAGLGLASTADAQVFVRAPFVRVQVGGPGVAVRAPFVNLFVPSGPTYYYAPPVYYAPRPVLPLVPGPVDGEPRIEFQPPPPQPAPQPQPQPQPQPLPKVTDDAPPETALPAKALTLQQFASSFKPKAGNYEVTLLNPATNEPTTVRFSLPEGTPRRVHVRNDEIEFDYGIRRFVRIEFDRDGAQVVSR